MAETRGPASIPALVHLRWESAAGGPSLDGGTVRALWITSVLRTPTSDTTPSSLALLRHLLTSHNAMGTVLISSSGVKLLVERSTPLRNVAGRPGRGERRGAWTAKVAGRSGLRRAPVVDDGEEPEPPVAHLDPTVGEPRSPPDREAEPPSPPSAPRVSSGGHDPRDRKAGGRREGPSRPVVDELGVGLGDELLDSVEVMPEEGVSLVVVDPTLGGDERAGPGLEVAERVVAAAAADPPER